MRRAAAATGILLLVLLALSRAPASAVFAPGPPPTDGGPAPAPAPPRTDTSEMIMSGTGPGAPVDGWLGPAGSVSNPAVAYPPDPTVLPGFASHPEGFAGIIFGAPTDGGPTLSLYCIDIMTLTYDGVGYNLGTWDASNVHNVGYVAYLLNNYYPNNAAQPAGLGDDSQRAAAVQAAIWYFSDNYVLTAGSDPFRLAVEAIVADALANGPLVAPDPPSLQITPQTAEASAGGQAGPFAIASPGGPATVGATGASMFSDTAGTVPVANGATVPDGGQLWLRSVTIGAAALAATASASVPSGNVYLYSGNLSGVSDAQRLILAEDTTLTTTVLAAAQFVADSGALIVTKTIDGPGAGSQAEIAITVSCGGTALAPDFVIPAGRTGTVTQRYDNIPTPVTCTITETVDGTNESVTVVTVNGSQTVTVPLDAVLGNAVSAQPITDTYETTTTTAPTTTTTASTTSPTDPSGFERSSLGRLPVSGGGAVALLAGVTALVAGGVLVWLARCRWRA